jgi:glycosyltransferase involved in cell wall biosynthesis
MPNALLEAMACKLAPIVTDASSGPLEAVIHRDTGLVVRSEDVSAIADAMRLLASDSDLMNQLAERASSYVRDHDWEVVERKWLQVLGLAGEPAGKID